MRFTRRPPLIAVCGLLLVLSLAKAPALQARIPAAAKPAPALAHASTSYTITTDIADGGGRLASSAAYSQSASVGAVVGIGSVASPSETNKAGFLGQIYNVVGFQLTAPGTAVNETATLQLTGNATLDDATLLAVPASAVTFSVISGPIASISASGLATAGTVYQNTAATVQGTDGSFSGTLGLTVYNVNDDNYGAYAGDGIDDAWQVQYFGPPPNPEAGPLVDADGTGQNNLFKYLAGLNPLDATSRFLFSVSPVTGQPTQKTLTLSPVYSGHTYTVQTSPSLTSPSWTTLTNSNVSVNGTTETVTDLGASTAPRFYRVLVSYP